MKGELAYLAEKLSAVGTLIGFCPSMGENMLFQILLAYEIFLAELAFEFLLLQVGYLHMTFKVELSAVGLPTVSNHAAVYCYNIFLYAIHFITNHLIGRLTTNFSIGMYLKIACDMLNARLSVQF